MMPPQAFRIDKEKVDFSHHDGEYKFVSSDQKSVDFYKRYVENLPKLNEIAKRSGSVDFFSKFTHRCLRTIRFFLHFGVLEDSSDISAITEFLTFERLCPNDLLKCQLEILLLRTFNRKEMTILDGIDLAIIFDLENLLWKLRGFLMR